MGCDGGTIPRRDELVKIKKKPEQKDKLSELSFRWQHCNISQEPLKKPIVACGLGRLYKKDVVIEKLLEKSLPESVSHIKNLKDIKDLNLTPNPAYKAEDEQRDNRADWPTSPYICPVTGLEMNGKFKFCLFWTCGCVMSERALKQFNDKLCLSCQTPYTDIDVVILNAVDTELELMTLRKEQRQNRTKSNKKSKKIKTEPEEEICVKNSKNEAVNGTVTTKNIKQEEPGTSSKITSKRPPEEIYDPAYKKAKQTYSVKKDPKATDVYKSLFTTHESAKSHKKAHWITYNPFYN